MSQHDSTYATSIKESILSFFAKFIAERLGIEYGRDNFYQLEARLLEIVRTANFSGVDELHERAVAGRLGSWETILLDVATNNETSFFRDATVSDGLAQTFFANDEYLSECRDLKIWCAAASTGQEPYTIAMSVADAALRYPLLKPRIIASDVSERVLEVARKGEYSSLQVQRGLPSTCKTRFFDEKSIGETSIWSVRDELKQYVEFRKHNLLDSFAHLPDFDLIFCRNVLIYQSVTNKEVIINRLFAKLNPGGCLILGGTESLIGIKSSFVLESRRGLLLYRRPDIRADETKSA